MADSYFCRFSVSLCRQIDLLIGIKSSNGICFALNVRSSLVSKYWHGPDVVMDAGVYRVFLAEQSAGRGPGVRRSSVADSRLQHEGCRRGARGVRGVRSAVAARRRGGAARTARRER